MKERVQQTNPYGCGYVAALIRVTRMNVVARGSPRQIEAPAGLPQPDFAFRSTWQITPFLETA
jgi:hypothetical protein